MSCKKDGKCYCSKFLFIAGVVASAYYMFKNYEIKIKLVRKNKENTEYKAEQTYVPEYVELGNSYVADYAGENFSQNEKSAATVLEDVEKEYAEESKEAKLAEKVQEKADINAEGLENKEEKKDDDSNSGKEGVFFQKL